MTTAHKTVLSLVAAICITLIVFYSVKGNAEHPGVSAPSMSATTANPTAAGGATTTAPASPVLARADEHKPASIDEIMAKVKQLDDLKSSSPLKPVEPRATEIRPAPALSNTPASTDAPVVSLNEAGSSTVSPTPSPEVGPAIATTEPTPASDDAAATGTSPSANGTAEVPSLTLGDSPATVRKTRSVFDADIKDLAELPAIETPLPVPALAKVPPPTEAAVKKIESHAPSASHIAPAPVTAAKTTHEATPATSAADAKVIVVDPHKPAVADSVPAAPASPVIASARSNEPAPLDSPASTNTPADAGRPVTAATDAAKPKAESVVTAPSKPDPQPASAAGAARTYTIKPGDTFSSIAIATYGAEKHWTDIAEANPAVDPKRVRVGQVIKLPELAKNEVKPAEAKAGAKAVEVKTTVKPDVKLDPKSDAKAATKPDIKPTAKPEAAKVEVRVHEVKAGESLISISRRYFKTPDNWRHVYLTNREIIGSDPAKLQTGMKLKIVAPPLED
jgi:nucleoid-associated protein YgaU